ncbi:MAG: hypothetical protein ACK4RV_11195 [Caulobacter sp.]
MAFTQLDPCLPVTVEGKGAGYAFAVIDYGQEHHLIWVVALNDSGEIWSAPNPKVRLSANWTMGRKTGAPGTGAGVAPLRPAAVAG